MCVERLTDEGYIDIITDIYELYNQEGHVSAAHECIRMKSIPIGARIAAQIALDKGSGAATDFCEALEKAIIDIGIDG